MSIALLEVLVATLPAVPRSDQPGKPTIQVQLGLCMNKSAEKGWRDWKKLAGLPIGCVFVQVSHMIKVWPMPQLSKLQKCLLASAAQLPKKHGNEGSF